MPTGVEQGTKRVIVSMAVVVPITVVVTVVVSVPV